MLPFFLRYLFFTLTIFLWASGQSPVTWEQLPGPSGGPVYKLIQLNNGMIYAACDGGGIFRTADGGASWDSLNNGLTDLHVRTLAAYGPYMITGTLSGTIYTSADTGNTWVKRQTLPSSITAVAVSTTLIMYAGTSNHGLYSSNSFGTSWARAGISEQFSGYNFSYVSSIQPLKSGKIVCGFRSIPGIVYSAPPGFDLPWVYRFWGEEKFFSMSMTPDGTVMMGSSGSVARSTTEFPFGTFTGGSLGLPKIPVISVACDTGGRMFAGTDGGGIYESVHDGTYWKPANTGLTGSVVQTLLSTNDGHLYAGTNDGLIFRTPAPTATLLSPKPETPYDVVTNTGQIQLRWFTRKGAYLYRVQISRDSLFPSPAVFEGTANNDTTITASHLDSVSFFFWRVRAENPQVNSEYSLVRRFITGPPPAPPALIAPADSAMNIQSGWIDFSWHSVPNAIGYRLHLQPAGNGSYGGMTMTTDTSARMYINERENSYQWSVEAANIAGYGQTSAPFTLTMIENVPLSPVLLSPSNHAGNQPATVTLSWRRPAKTLRHKIRVAKTSSFTSGIVLIDSTVVDTFFTVTNLQAETRYYWQVFGINNGGTGYGSEVFTFRTSVAAPPVPTGLQPSDKTEGAPLLTSLKWNPAPRADSYYVWITLDPDDWFTYGMGVVVMTPELTAYFDPGRTYYWRVAAVNPTGASPWTNVFSFTTAGSKNIERLPASLPTEHGLNQNFPNPFNAGTEIRFDIPDYQYVSLKIYSISGIEIESLFSELLAPGTYRVRWTPTNLPSGVYFCRMQTILSHYSFSRKEFVTTKKMLYVK